MREDPADLNQTKLAVLGERSEIAGGVMAGLDSSSSSSSSSVVAGCVTREDAAFNQPKVVQYLELFLPFLLEVAGGLAEEIGGGFALLVLLLLLHGGGDGGGLCDERRPGI